MIRIAAVGDLHYDHDRRETLKEHFDRLSDCADLFLIAGDLTQSGALEEARALADDLGDARIPVVLVLGNHDYHQNKEDEIKRLFTNRGMTVLDGENAILRVGNESIGIVGLKGFGGGFFGACVTEFGEPEMKSFAHHSRSQAEILRDGLARLKTDYKFALLHFSPVEGTLLGERREIYPFLGSYLMAEAIDASPADGVFHGHAHHGVEKGSTIGGVPVRNVALPVIRHAYNIYVFDNNPQAR